MYTGNVWGIALLIAGFLTTLVAFQLLLAAVFPAWAGRTADVLRRRTLASGLVGAGVLVMTIVVAAVAMSLLGKLGGPGKLANALLVAALTIPSVLGLATVSRFVGERMPSPVDADRPWRATLRGGVTCALAFATPVVGWFVVLPAALATGLGAVTLALFERAPAPDVAPVAAAEAGAAA
jgi:hypothetical protein